jgi:hypothetical protein
MAVIGPLLDVDFVYEETATEDETPAGTIREAAARLPADLRTALIEATEAGYVFRLRELIANRVTPQEFGWAQEALTAG